MYNLRKPTGRWGGFWKLLVVFVIGGYTLTSVLAFDSQGNRSLDQGQLSEKLQASQPLHAQIEENVAFGARKVWKNLVNFMQEGFDTKEGEKGEKNWSLTGETTPPLVKTPEGKNQPIIRTNFSESESVLLPLFEDIAKDPQKESIETLASIGVVNWGANGKYQPLNHVRCSDFVRVVVDIYRHKAGYSLESTKGLTDQQLLSLKNPDTLLSKKLNTAKHLWFLENVNAMIRDHTITPLQAQLILNNIFTLYPHLGQKEKIKLINTTKSVLTKSEMAGYLVAIFQLEPQETDSLFRDIHNHRYQNAIIQLAQLGVVAGRNGNFYPDNDTLRADGVIMIANSMLAKEQKALVIKNFYHLNSIADVTYFAAFAPHLEFLLDHKIGTSLLRHEQSGDLFLPYALLTKWEAYSLITQAAGIKILNPDAWSATKPITRGELAQLLVEAFDFAHLDAKSEPWIPEETSVPTDPEKKKSVFVSLLKDIVNEL